jgi:signal transduction histidine kinase
MRERAELAGGWLRVTSELGAGTVVECWLPLPR